MRRRDTRAIGAGLLMALCSPTAVHADEAVELPLVIGGALVRARSNMESGRNPGAGQ